MLKTDASGNRVRSVVNGTAVNYLVDDSFVYPQVVSEYYDNGTLKTEYHRGLGLISMEESGGSEHFYRYDALGSVRALSDGGSVTDTYDYDPYGKVLEHTGTTDNSFMFTGEQYDEETGNYYLRARYYNPTAGQFTSRDSYEGDDRNPITLNKYAYANSNPTMYTDPSGKFGILELIEIQSVIDINSQTAMGMSFKFDAPEETERKDKMEMFKNRYYWTEDAAAWDATNYINPISVAFNWEYGGWVLQLKGSIGLYYAIHPTPGVNEGGSWDPGANIPKGENTKSAIYHTHGKTDYKYEKYCKEKDPSASVCKYRYADLDEDFSDFRNGRDVMTLQHYGVNGYLGTARGWFMKWSVIGNTSFVHPIFPRISSPQFASEDWNE